MAQGAAGLREDPADECSEQGGESDGEEPETHRSRLPESWALPASDIVVHGGATPMLNILHHAEVLRATLKGLAPRLGLMILSGLYHPTLHNVGYRLCK